MLAGALLFFAKNCMVICYTVVICRLRLWLGETKRVTMLKIVLKCGWSGKRKPFERRHILLLLRIFPPDIRRSGSWKMSVRDTLLPILKWFKRWTQLMSLQGIFMWTKRVSFRN
uniref:Uncharacterized protein n=1 Tax=Arundo donax TaxID=35708 RepID=A0A0A9GGS7_ARUDO